MDLDTKLTREQVITLIRTMADEHPHIPNIVRIVAATSDIAEAAIQVASMIDGKNLEDAATLVGCYMAAAIGTGYAIRCYEEANFAQQTTVVN